MSMSSIYPTQFNGKKSEKIPYEKFKNLKDKDLIIYYSRNYLYRNFYDTFSDGEIADFLVIHPNKGIIFIESKNGIISYNKNEGQWYQNEKTLFKINQKFRIFTKNLKKEEKEINTKGRVFKIINFYQGVARFNFNQLCDQNLGAEDYLNLSQICKHVFIEEIPNFNEFKSNQQLRFITLIDIFYEKKISLTISLNCKLDKLGTSKKHSKIFKRTLSRLYEMTMSKCF